MVAFLMGLGHTREQFTWLGEVGAGASGSHHLPAARLRGSLPGGMLSLLPGQDRQPHGITHTLVWMGFTMFYPKINSYFNSTSLQFLKYLHRLIMLTSLCLLAHSLILWPDWISHQASPPNLLKAVIFPCISSRCPFQNGNLESGVCPCIIAPPRPILCPQLQV